MRDESVAIVNDRVCDWPKCDKTECFHCFDAQIFHSLTYSVIIVYCDCEHSKIDVQKEFQTMS